jgi:deazaflavin-dependent oxidoreductase (nitroreductase family)
MSEVSRRALPRIDRFVLERTGGRSTATSSLTGLAPLWVTTIGAKSGAERTVALFGIPFRDDLALLGTSFGQKATPSWVYNLAANPEARVAYLDSKAGVFARPATPSEEPDIWEKAAEVYPGYANYVRRAATRRIRVFVLEMQDLA